MFWQHTAESLDEDWSKDEGRRFASGWPRPLQPCKGALNPASASEHFYNLYPVRPDLSMSGLAWA